MAKSILYNPNKDGCQPCSCLHPDGGTAAKMASIHMFKITYEYSLNYQPGFRSFIYLLIQG